MSPKPYVPAAPPPRETRNGIEIENVKAQNYSTEQVDTCLALIVRFGNYQRVCDIVKDEFGWDIGRQALRDWKTRAYPMRYQSILIELQPEIREQSIRNYSDAVTKLQDAQDRAINKVVDSIDDLEPKDASGALRNVAIALGVNTDKHLLTSGQPTSIVGHITADDVLRNLKAKHYVTIQADIVDGEATEETT